ncbi:MAG: NAD(P)H-binding protein [Gemmatimonadaceae bacterium]|nr:NAD(P)H-binding protein [Gemmatimonadaceae bacterium]
MTVSPSLAPLQRPPKAADAPRLVVLGASGGCGSWVVRLAAARGWQVTATVRPGSSIAVPAGVQVRVGDVTDVRFLDDVLPDATVVVSALGLRRAGLSPWARLLSPPDLTSGVVERLLPVMRWHGVPRLLAISAGGVAESRSQLSWTMRQVVDSGNVAVAYRDLERMEATLAASDVDWEVVRPVTLLSGRPTGRATAVDRYTLTSTVRRADVAAHLVRRAASGHPLHTRAVLLGQGATDAR